MKKPPRRAFCLLRKCSNHSGLKVHYTIAIVMGITSDGVVLRSLCILDKSMQCTLKLFYTAQKQVVQYSFVPLHTTPSFGQTSFNFHSPSSQSFNAISLPLQFTLVSHPIVEVLKVLESGVPPVICRDIGSDGVYS